VTARRKGVSSSEREIAGYLDQLHRRQRRYETDPAYRAHIDAIAADVDVRLARRRGNDQETAGGQEQEQHGQA
jgi:hypothetical protein